MNSVQVPGILSMSVHHLVIIRPDLLYEIDEIADLGWLSTVTGIREYPVNYWQIPINTERRDYHLQLLLTYLESSLLHMDELTIAHLAQRLDSLLDGIGNRLNLREASALTLYRYVASVVGELSRNVQGGATSQLGVTGLSDLIQLADLCFYNMTELEKIYSHL